MKGTFARSSSDTGIWNRSRKPRSATDALARLCDPAAKVSAHYLIDEDGTVTALVGVNGAGKSTLFKAIMGFVPTGAGEITLMGRPVARALRENLVAYVPQAEEVDWSFPVLVEDVVMMGRYGHMGFLRRPSGADRAAVDAALGGEVPITALLSDPDQPVIGVWSTASRPRRSPRPSGCARASERRSASASCASLDASANRGVTA